jgi:hypothetical protein
LPPFANRWCQLSAGLHEILPLLNDWLVRGRTPNNILNIYDNTGINRDLPTNARGIMHVYLITHFSYKGYLGTIQIGEAMEDVMF